VPTLEGKINLKIPAGTPSGKVFRLRNKGIVVLGSNRRGDQHVRVMVEVPKKISEKRRKILEQLAELDKEEAEAVAKGGIFDGIKNFFA
jgi:molecular chaperone DnaJ